MTDLGGNQRYRVKTESVAAKTFDQEVVILNMSSAIYYDLDGCGFVIWSHLDAGYSPRATAERLADEMNVGVDAVETDVNTLVTRLLEEELIEAVAAPAEDGTPAIEISALAYTAPELHRHDDMQDLLALDPPLLDSNEA